MAICPLLIFVVSSPTTQFPELIMLAHISGPLLNYSLK